MALEDQPGRSDIIVTETGRRLMRDGAVAQQFDVRRGLRRRQRRHLDLRSTDIVEKLLRAAAVMGSRREAQTQSFIKGDTTAAIGDTDRGVVDAQKQIVVWRSLPI